VELVEELPKPGPSISRPGSSTPPVHEHPLVVVREHPVAAVHDQTLARATGTVWDLISPPAIGALVGNRRVQNPFA